MELPFSRNVMVVGQGLKPNSCTGHKVRACVPFGGDITRRAAQDPIGDALSSGLHTVTQASCAASQLQTNAHKQLPTNPLKNAPWQIPKTSLMSSIFHISNSPFQSQPTTIPSSYQSPLPSLDLSTNPKTLYPLWRCAHTPRALSHQKNKYTRTTACLNHPLTTHHSPLTHQTTTTTSRNGPLLQQKVRLRRRRHPRTMVRGQSSQVLWETRRRQHGEEAKAKQGTALPGLHGGQGGAGKGGSARYAGQEAGEV